MTATPIAPKLILQDTRSLLYYNRNLGGFSEKDSTKATVLDNLAQAAFVKAHFQRPEFIDAIPFVEDKPVAPAFTAEDLPKLAAAIDAAPNADNAHLNRHINGSIRAHKTHHGRDGSRSYRFGNYRIELTISRTTRKQGCGYRKTTTSTNFDLINRTTGEHSYLNTGGLKAALAAIYKQEMKRHGIA